MLKIFVTGLVVLASIPLVFAQSKLDPDYVQGYDSWKARDYPTASTKLARYRIGKPYAQNYDVDYWLGTSWCRLTGAEPAGLDMLDWGLQFSQMPQAAKNQYRTERDACRLFLRQPTIVRLDPVAVAAALGAAGATSRSAAKLYYVAGGDKGGLVAYPLRVKRPLSPAEYDARLMALSDESTATLGVKKRAPGFVVVRHGRFILASGSPGHTATSLEMIGRRLDDYVSFLVTEYGLSLPEYFFTVYLVPNIPRLQTFAADVHGLDASPLTLGYTFQNDLSVVAVLNGTAVGTLLHELFHLTVRSTYGAIPQWLDEGTASLYETSTVAGHRYYGEPNWRSEVVNLLRGQFPNIRVANIITTPWFGDEPASEGAPERISDQQAYTLALSRYFVMFLQERGVLKQVFAAYRDRKPPAEYVPAERQAMQLLERATGKSLADIDQNSSPGIPRCGTPLLDCTPARSSIRRSRASCRRAWSASLRQGPGSSPLESCLVHLQLQPDRCWRMQRPTPGGIPHDLLNVHFLSKYTLKPQTARVLGGAAFVAELLASRHHRARSRGGTHGEGGPPWAVATFNRYGSETVAPSPAAEITKVPAEVLPAYAYGVVQPVGGTGRDAMNGPAVWFWPLVATAVSGSSVAGTEPM